MNVKGILWSCALSLALVSAPMAMADTKPQGNTADIILKKIHELDLLNQILPALLTKDQIRALMPEIEKARDVVKKAEAAELEELKKLDAKIDPALKDAYAKGKVPDTKVLSEYWKTFAKMRQIRQALIDINTTNVTEVLKKHISEGQLAAIRNALNPGALDPSLDPAKMTDDEKVRFWVKYVLLDYASYDILIKLSK